MNSKPIGVFDSGVGGLTTLGHLVDELECENFIYIGDTKNCPYGLKTKEELENIVEKMIRYFEKIDVKAIVIACNTATANSYHIKSHIPIIRIIEPTCREALKESNSIGVIATNYTIESKAYEKFLKNNMLAVKASPLVDIVEEGLQNTEKSKEVVEDILLPLKNKIDTLVLGCTHFGLLEKDIKNFLPDVRIVDSSKCVSSELKKVMADLNINNTSKERFVKIFTTGEISKFKIDWVNFSHEQVKKIDIESENKNE